jgi:hypothetical protein
LTTNTVHTTDDISDETGTTAFPAGNAVNTTINWITGPFAIAPDDDVIVVYTGTNTSDSGLASLGNEEQDDLELEILNSIFKRGVALVSGVALGAEIGALFSDAFKEVFKDPVGDLIGYSRQGPCNGPVFADAIRFSGRQLDDLVVGPIPYLPHNSGTVPGRGNYPNPGVRYTRHYTDEASHDSEICGHFAETDVTFSISRLPYISVKDLMRRRFPSYYPYIRKGARPSGEAFSLKRVLGVLP